MWALTIIFAIFTAFVQSTIAPSLVIYSGIIDFSLVVVMICLFYGSVRQACLFLIISSIVLTILSDVPLIFIVLPLFLLIVGYILLSNRRIISRPTTIIALPVLFLASVFVNLIKITIMQRFSILLITPIISSSILTAIIGGIIYYFCNKIYNFLNPQLLREKIKIGRF